VKDMNKGLMKYVLAGILLLIVFPTVYVVLLNEVVPHPGLNLTSQWSDYTFKDWSTDMNAIAEGNVESENGVLSVNIESNCAAGAIVAAQRKRDLPNGLSPQSFLKVLVKTSSINVAARVVIWTNATYSKEVLVKTYNDVEWHTEIVDLSFFDVPADIYMIELSAMQVYVSDSSDWVSYSQLSFEEMEI